MTEDIQAYLDLLIVLAVIGTVIGVVIAVVIGFVRVGYIFAPYFALGGLILLLLEFLK